MTAAVPRPDPTPTGAVEVVAAVVAAGVDTVFGLPGTHNHALWPAAAAAGLRVVGSRHEQGCAYAADGYARVRGGAGAAWVTTGPGAANTVAAIGEAWASKSPVVVVATDIPSTVRRPGVYRGWLHECTDQAALFAPVTKARFVAGPGAVGPTVARAFEVALAPPRGPVYVGVPTDLLASPVVGPVVGPVEGVRPPAALAGGPPGGLPVGAGGTGAAPPVDAGGDWRPAVRALLQTARRPVVWAGRGAADAGPAVRVLAERLGAPVVTTFGARGILPAGHPLLVDLPPHEPVVTRLLARADLVVVLGSDLDAMTTQGWRLPLPRRRLAVNVDRADATKAYAFDEVVVGDVADVVPELAGLVEPRTRGWAPPGPSLRAEVLGEAGADPDTGAAVQFLDATARALPADVVLVADMAVAGYWLAAYHPVAGPRSLLYPMGWGTLGFAFPAAVGAVVGAGDRPVVAVCGDGGFLFATGELATVAQEALPLTVVVVDDDGYGMLRHGTPDAPEAVLGIRLRSPDFAALARAFGIGATTVEGFGDPYVAALAEAVAADGPRLVHVRASLHPPITTSPRWPLRGAPPPP